MKKILVGENEAGQRLDKLLARYLNRAPMSFLYKMLRKKNITLNGKKAAGKEQTAAGDVICIYLADETYRKFSQETVQEPLPAETVLPAALIYEDEHILVINKPAGLLSQKSAPSDVSANEQILAYLLQSGAVTPESLAHFRPSVCNRLDRNTSGLLLAGKTLSGAQALSACLRDRSLHKYYLCLVEGVLQEERRLEGFWQKDGRTNTAAVSAKKQTDLAQEKRIVTQYRPLWTDGACSLLEVWLITGRSHQIRAHLASIGHPLIGDGKYGKPALNARYRRQYGLQSQLLHAWRIELPQLDGPLFQLSGREFMAPLPPLFEKILEEKNHGYLELPGASRLPVRRSDQPLQ